MKIINSIIVFASTATLMLISHSVPSSSTPTLSHATDVKKEQAKSETASHATTETQVHEKAAQPHWTHAGESGPNHWAALSSDYALCRSGKRQSPIDVVTIKSKKANLYTLQFDYQPLVLQAINNGHTLQANYYRKEMEHSVTIKGETFPINGQHHYDSSLLIGDEKYNLLQFHYHTPSEHHLNSMPYAMEVHLVHQNSAGNLAVVGVMLKIGDKSPVLQTLLDNVTPAAGPVVVNTDIKINAQDLLPKNQTAFHYTGSLTTPPCSENVNWYLLANARTVSIGQLASFKRVIGNNSRPIQPLNWRSVVTSP